MKVISAELTPNQWSRPQIKLKQVKGLVVHYVGNPGTSAMFNRNYFENRKHVHNGYGSAHFIVGLSGEIISCIPVLEVAYHCGEDKQHGFLYTDFARERFGTWPNSCTLSIEMCHLDKAGVFAPATLFKTEMLCACLCEEFDLDPISDMIRHYDITHKICPRWFVDHPEYFEQFKASAKQRMLQAECNGDGD
jgi:N-acetylmuramoyl-L-alanine amidase